MTDRLGSSIGFWFDFASTYSYPAAVKAGSMARKEGVSLSWHPFLLGAIFNDQGLNDSPFNINAQKGRYMWRDIERICANQRILFRRPSRFPRNGLVASRIVCSFNNAVWIDEFIHHVFLANFYYNQDISDKRILGDILSSIGLDDADIMARASSDDAKQALRDQTDEVKRRGIFGTPTLMVGNEMFWGHDRVEQAFDFALGRYP